MCKSVILCIDKSFSVFEEYVALHTFPLTIPNPWEFPYPQIPDSQVWLPNSYTKNCHLYGYYNNLIDCIFFLFISGEKITCTQIS